MLTFVSSKCRHTQRHWPGSYDPQQDVEVVFRDTDQVFSLMKHRASFDSDVTAVAPCCTLLSRRLYAQMLVMLYTVVTMV